MIEETRPPTFDGPRGSPASGRPASPPRSTATVSPAEESLGLRHRLAGVAGELERLQENLAGVRGPQERRDVERSISAAQVAMQNILSVGTEEPAMPAGTPPLSAIALDRRNALDLLAPS